MLKIPEQLFDTIYEFLGSINWLSASYQLKPLYTDSSNYSFQLMNAGECYFVKYFGQTRFIPYNRKTVFELQWALSQQGLAIEPLLLSEDQSIQVEAWCSKSAEIGRSLSVAKAAEILAELHQTTIEAPPLELVSHWDRYLQLCPEKSRSGFVARIEQLQGYWKAEELTCLCHNDLAFDHIVNAESNVLYDWEYVAMGNPCFDLASTIALNELSTDESTVFLTLYNQRRNLPVPAIEHRVSDMRPLVQLTSDIWWAAYHHQNKVM